MSILLILFFISLAGITFMVSSKLLLLKNGKLASGEDFSIELPDLYEVRYFVIKNSKKYGYVLLVETIRFSILSSNYLKHKSIDIKNKLMSIKNRYFPTKKTQPAVREVSGFLKKISEYKHKINEIKHMIKEEEGLE